MPHQFGLSVGHGALKSPAWLTLCRAYSRPSPASSPKSCHRPVTASARTIGGRTCFCCTTPEWRPEGSARTAAQAGSEVSSHYFVFEDGRIVQLVQEARRAWHAGVSFWAGETDINSRSIGIEIANPGHEYGYRDFPDAQIEAVIALCRDIGPAPIPPERVLAHSDVAPTRKEDPGERFPWRTLADAGVGHWVEAGADQRGGLLLASDRGEDVLQCRRARRYGYGVEERQLRRRHARRRDGIPAPFPPRARRRPRRCFDAHDAAELLAIAAAFARSRHARVTRNASPLTAASRGPIPSRSVGRTAARGNSRKVAGEESPGSMDMRCRITSGGARKPGSGKVPQRADRRGALRLAAARVKRCGKSAPRLRQRKRHGKPHREQDRIGTARMLRAGGNPGPVSGSGRPGRLLEAPGNRRPRGMAVTRAACAAALQNPAYRPADDYRGGPVGISAGPRQFSEL